jgi:hypothetical protein
MGRGPYIVAMATLVAACMAEDANVRVEDRVSGALVAGASVKRVGNELEVAAPGYLTMRVPAGEGVVRLFPEVTSEGEDERLSERWARRSVGEGDVRASARVLEERARSEEVASVGTIGIPETIRVWRRGLDGSSTSCTGRVDVLPFDKYVKGVLPHEWIPSWNPLALQMGAIAIRSYAAAWVAAGGRYECADLDDTAASQVYRD